MFVALLVAAGCVVPGATLSDDGVIRGRVVNASQNHRPCARAEVVLRAVVDGQLVPVAETLSDERGFYEFSGLPVGSECVYLPGANHDGIHYPGRRVELTAAKPTLDVPLAVHDAVAEPSPLIIRRHEIAIRTAPGAIHVEEAMLIDNPTLRTYVGRAAHEDAQPLTLQLGIPADFERVTFEKESFGRQFTLIDGRLVTSLPWLPGERWLRFTYTLRNDDGQRVWQRTVDAPCESLRVQVRHEKPDEVEGSLPAAAGDDPGEKVFASEGDALSRGQIVTVRLGALPIAWTTYARWSAVVLLSVLVLGAAIAMRFGRKPSAPAENAKAQDARGTRRSASRKAGKAAR